MKTILIATNNRGKAAEIKNIFQGSDFDLKFLFDFPEELNDLKITENAKSFEGNALIKAIVVGDTMNMLTLADDSGICVDALNGAPGVYSARYSETGDDKSNYLKLLEEMKDISPEKRSCHYSCAVAIYNPENKFVETVFGNWHGRVAIEAKGDKSFGYAPIFLSENFDYKKTNAEYDPKELITINHRGQAFKKALEILNNLKHTIN